MRESEVIALMLEAAPVEELGMLSTGGMPTSMSLSSTTTSSLAWKMGSVKVPIFLVSWEVPVAKVLRDPTLSKPQPEPSTPRGAKLK